MRSAWLLSAIFALEAPAAWAAPRTPCDRAEAPAVVALADRLARSDDPDAWRSLMPAAAEAATVDSLSPADRACAAYVAGSAAFFLSADRGAGRPYAVAAVAHFARAEAIAPDAMGARQPRSRMTTAWQRLGPAPGWLRARTPLPFAIPGGPPGTVRLGPADPAAWAGECPGDGCAVAIEVPRGAAGASVSLRPGWYRIEHVGRCGTSEAVAELRGGVLPVPEPAVCTARVEVSDGGAAIDGFTLTVDGAAVEPAAAPVAVPMRIEAPGYVPRTVKAPDAGGPLPVALDRCPVTLDVHTRPADARVEGAGPGPWGERTVRATAPGHGPVERTVDVPPPEGCQGRHRITLELPRPVSVVGTDHGGRAVSIARLVVQGETVDAVGLYRPPGRYGLQAMHPTLGVATTKFEVTPCDGAECGPVRVDVRFPPPPETGPGAGPTVAYVTGGVLLGLSGLAGISAWRTHGDIQNYESKANDRVPLRDLVDERDSAARAADVLLVTGGVALLTGWLWSRLAGDE